MHAEAHVERSFEVATREGFAIFFDTALVPAYRSIHRLTGGDRALAEDLVQEAFRSLADAVRAGRVVSVDQAWIVTVARRRYIDLVRRRMREESKLRLVHDAAERGVEPDVRTATQRSNRGPVPHSIRSASTR